MLPPWHDAAGRTRHAGQGSTASPRLRQPAWRSSARSEPAAAQQFKSSRSGICAPCKVEKRPLRPLRPPLQFADTPCHITPYAKLSRAHAAQKCARRIPTLPSPLADLLQPRNKMLSCPASGDRRPPRAPSAHPSPSQLTPVYVHLSISVAVPAAARVLAADRGWSGTMSVCRL